MPTEAPCKSALAMSRSLTATGLALWLSERSAATRNPPSCSLESCPSSTSSGDHSRLQD
ncbi:unnamed protein product [Staurois parvus]|uniref:Uncharacterized protein n=1 Tax=Staurois parvus TaxID=386267 RepID=A0ABN9ACW0_9NEOB|nr:unnamed protein product [Staurois parvus]